MHDQLRCSIRRRLAGTPSSRSGTVLLGQIKARLRHTFKSSENQRAALIDFSTVSLGQQSTFSPADFW